MMNFKNRSNELNDYESLDAFYLLDTFSNKTSIQTYGSSNQTRNNFLKTIVQNYWL